MQHPHQGVENDAGRIGPVAVAPRQSPVKYRRQPQALDQIGDCRLAVTGGQSVKTVGGYIRYKIRIYTLQYP